MAIQFQHNYQLLELDATSNWDDANRNYRRLVHIWHPDRFAQRPRERIHAQQQFIELTKAFNNLRAFYRENQHMPYEQIKQSIADAPEPPDHQRVMPNDDLMSETSMLNKRKPSAKKREQRARKPLVWVLPTGAAIAVALFGFVLIDHGTKISAFEEAKRVLQSAKPSEYMRDNDKISQANSRAALIDKSGSSTKMGDQLTKDLFK